MSDTFRLVVIVVPPSKREFLAGWVCHYSKYLQANRASEIAGEFVLRVFPKLRRLPAP